MTKILITGVTSRGAPGVYERQLGNVAILIPMVQLLKQYLPDVEISTDIQLRDEFCARYGITSIPKPKQRLPRFNLVLELALVTWDVFRVSLWECIKDATSINAKFLIKGKKFQKFTETDMVLDFSGDIFPSDTSWIGVLIQALEVVTIKKLGCTVIEFVSSPGPFNTWFRRAVAKLMYENIDLFLNREELSSELLKQLGVKKPILTTACPAFLLIPDSPERGKEIMAQEGVDVNSKPLIGLTLAGYNLSQRSWRKPKSFEDLKAFIPTLRWLLDDLKATVVLLPHVYRTNPYVNEYELVNGPDHDILLNLFRMVNGENYEGKLRLVEGKYTASEVKSLIGQFDMLISGRLHAGVAALSQGIPTVLLAYGHKHRGFARLVGQEKYAYSGKDSKKLLSLVKEAWQNRSEIKKTIQEKMPRVSELVRLNFEIIKEMASLDKGSRGQIPQEVLDSWIERSEKLKA
jgi:colanic acid/amylovoran biosynthesis protein